MTRIAPPPLVTISTRKDPPLSRCSIILWIPLIATAAGIRNCADVRIGPATLVSTAPDTGSTFGSVAAVSSQWMTRPARYTTMYCTPQPSARNRDHGHQQRQATETIRTRDGQ